MDSDDIELEPNDDPDVLSNDSSKGKDPIKKLKEKLKIALEEKQKYLDGWQRDKAEFINSRKRDQEDKANFMRFAEENIISELIPVLDSFDMAMGNKEAWEKADKNWRIGVEYIYSQLTSILDSHGLIKINPLGKAFDPKEHHSIVSVKTDKKEDDHKVVEVVSAGYILNGKVIKAAQVKVGEYNKKE